MAVINGDRIKAELLSFYCSSHWGFEVVAVELSGAEGITAVSRTKPEFVLVSLSLPDLTAPEIIRQILAASPTSKIISQTTQCSEYFLHLVSGIGYHGMIFDADESLVSLGQIINRVRHGLRSVSPRIAEGLAALRAGVATFPKLLSKREQEVMVCIAHSLSDDEIALQLHLAAGTALSHRKKIMHKLGIHSTPKLIRYCADKGFNSVPPPTSPKARADAST